MFLERTHSGLRICFLEQMAVEGGVSYTTWTAQVDSKAIFPTAMATSLGLREHAFAATPGKTNY